MSNYNPLVRPPHPQRPRPSGTGLVRFTTQTLPNAKTAYHVRLGSVATSSTISPTRALTNLISTFARLSTSTDHHFRLLAIAASSPNIGPLELIWPAFFSTAPLSPSNRHLFEQLASPTYVPGTPLNHLTPSTPSLTADSSTTPNAL